MGVTADIGDQLEMPLREAMQEQWDAAVIVTTPIVGARLLGAELWLGDLLDADSPLAVRALVIDEAHRAAAPTYQRLIASACLGVKFAGARGRLDCHPLPHRRSRAASRQRNCGTTDHFRRRVDLAKVSGLTPRRCSLSGGAWHGLHTRPFGVSTSPSSLTLATMLKSGSTMNSVSWQARISAVAAESSNHSTNSCRRTPRLRRVLYFGPTVTDAEVMSFLLQKQGYGSAVVSAKTHAPVRREIVRQFKSGAYHVLCNHGVLNHRLRRPERSRTSWSQGRLFRWYCTSRW